ncbi:GAD-like domain-containing protein [Aggregatibacter kilianii]|uniref:GAD-like domain-containing protein n=1 Tax=Aggregatibacter kilianii TaxID=2025884 RepID=UPI0028D857F5|nr:GAD-like domain-containing protein [Aggregatibacter kilianii]
MNTIQQFIQRNQHTYVKHSDAPKEVIEKYRNMYQGQSYFPEELIWIWENMGFGVYEDGFLQIVNPDEYEFVFEYIDKLLEPTVVWGVTALGDLLVWEGNDNWTIAPDEGNRYSFIDVNELKDSVDSSRVDVFLNILVNDEEDLTEDFVQNLIYKLKESCLN